MTLTRTLLIEEKYLKFDDMRAIGYCERRWKEEGRPTERWEVINFLEKMIRELKEEQGGYPKVLLFRKKQIQRREFEIQKPGETPAGGCTCFGGYLINGTVCPCPKGEPHREQFRKWGMQI
jgi:hypothetical protein